jgi:hypothetical protein
MPYITFPGKANSLLLLLSYFCKNYEHFYQVKYSYEFKINLGT